jgi:DASS family divalent anion:Na+ symporter
MSNQPHSSANEVDTPPQLWKGAAPLPFFATLIFGSVLWLLPVPEGLDTRTWHLFAIFVSTIFAIIVKPLPMGAITLISLAFCLGTKTLTLNEALGHFNSNIVWLVVFAFFIARAFIKTGLGNRIAYWFIAIFGSSSLGLAYSLVLSEFLLSPAVPSNTARGAGIMFPIAKSLCEAQGSLPDKNTRKKLGAFLIKVCFQTNVLVSALFITAIASNPLIVSLAADVDIEITWLSWATATIVPGLINLGVLPLVIYFFCTPHLKKTPEAPQMARRKLQELGRLKFDEQLMMLSFGTLLSLWVFGDYLGIDAATAALFGCAFLLFTGILKWDDIIKEKAAWETLIWFAVLLMMASLLNKFGMIKWFSSHVQSTVGHLDWRFSLTILALIYFYTHYFFASATAHVSSMYSAFLVVALATGAPPMLAAMLLAVVSSLCGGLTHYGTGSAPVYFGAGYLPVAEWWRTGGIVSMINLLIWFTVGGLWWKYIGLW